MVSGRGARAGGENIEKARRKAIGARREAGQNGRPRRALSLLREVLFHFNEPAFWRLNQAGLHARQGIV